MQGRPRSNVPPAYPAITRATSPELRAAAELQKLGSSARPLGRAVLDASWGTFYPALAAIMFSVLGTGALVFAVIGTKPVQRGVSVLCTVGCGCIAVFMMLVRRAHVRARRALNGQCVDCGYDLRQSEETCPKCGRPNPARSADAGPQPVTDAELLAQSRATFETRRFAKVEMALLFLTIFAAIAAGVTVLQFSIQKPTDALPWPRWTIVVTVSLFVVALTLLLAMKWWTHRRAQRALHRRTP